MIVLDTHVVLWLALERSRVSLKAREAIVKARESGANIFVATITLWEITFLHNRNRIQLSMELRDFLEGIEERFSMIPVSTKVCLAANRLTPNFPNDPVDRIIGASALAEGAALVTADEPIHKAKAFETIW